MSNPLLKTESGVCVAFIIASNDSLAAAGETAEECQADFDAMEGHEFEDDSLEGPYLAIVRRYGRSWERCADGVYCRIRNIGVANADAYQIGPEPGANWFTSRAEAIEAAKGLDEIGFDTEVVEFTGPLDRHGNVVWGYLCK